MNIDIDITSPMVKSKKSYTTSERSAAAKLAWEKKKAADKWKSECEAVPRPPTPPAAGVASSGGGVPMIDGLTFEQQNHLEAYNAWQSRWNDYQANLAQYWEERYHALYQEKALGGGPTKRGKGKGKTGKKSLSEGRAEMVERKWSLRYQEREYGDSGIFAL